MKEELTLKYDDGCFTDTYTYQRLKELNNGVERLEEQLEREKNIVTTLVRWLQDRKEMTDEQFYTLEGLRVNAPSRAGLYIREGKKIVVRRAANRSMNRTANSK